MKKLTHLILLTLSLTLLISTPLLANTKKEEQAIKKQIKLLESGLQTHNYQKIKKVVKKPYSNFCSFTRIDKLIGKNFLKERSEPCDLEVKYITIYGNTANVTLSYHFIDCSTVYFETHKQLYLDQKHSPNHFKKKLKEIEKKWKGYQVLGYIGRDEWDVTMKKVKGKWVFESDPNANFFDMYSNGYLYCMQLSNNVSWNDW